MLPDRICCEANVKMFRKFSDNVYKNGSATIEKMNRKHGIEDIAFYADEPNHIPWLVKKNRSREKLVAVAVWLDVNILNKQPKFPK